MYLALYRKYRPVTFEDVISQEHITRTLQNEIMSGKTAHAYLFTGPRGTGKTTCSKILSMAVNCENPHDGNPCLECDSCKSIMQGTTMDVVEIDGASNNRVDDIRDLREEAVYTPTSCKYRVYIIDEVHMLSTGAFNALLKIMEEPPEHVKFIMATTEPHKVPATILSRCQQFDFRRIKPDDIAKRILEISEKEDFTIDEPAANLIARLADGGMRDALSLLDQCSAYSQDITLETVSLAAGISGREDLFSLTDCIVDNNAAGAISLISDLYERSKDLLRLLSEMIHQFRNIMLMQTLKSGSSVIDAMPDELERLLKYARDISPMRVITVISDMQACLDSMAKAIDKRTALEMCFVKICTPAMNTDNSNLIARIERLEAIIKNNAAAIPQKQQAVNTAQEQTVSAELTQQKPQADIKAEPDSDEKASDAIADTADTSLDEKNQIDEKKPVKAQTPEKKPKTAKSGDYVSYNDIAPLECWTDVMEELHTCAGHIYAALKGAQVMAGGGVLYISSPMPMFAKMLKQDGFAAKLVNIVEQKSGVRYKLRVKSAASPETEKMQQESKLSSILNKARENGVEVKED